MVNIIKGNLIDLALQGEFDVIAHGCNCFCKQESGIAKLMNHTFGTGDEEFGNDNLESSEFEGDKNKLGQIDSESRDFYYNKDGDVLDLDKEVIVVNMYTQYMYGVNHVDGAIDPYDENAIIMCLKKLNRIFKGLHIGLPYIGCGLASLPEYRDSRKIDFEKNCKTFLNDCKVTIVEYEN